MSKIPIKIRVNGKQKTIGIIIDGYLAVFKRRKSQHYFRKFKGWAISTSALFQLKSLHIPYIIIYELESQDKFRVKTSIMDTKGTILTSKYTKGDEQIVLAQSEFEKL